MIRPANWIALVVVCFGIASRTEAQQAPSHMLTKPQADAVDEGVQAEMERQHLVGVAVGVIRKGEIVYVQGYGFADRESGEKVTQHTVFNWASNSKPLAAVLAMQLVDAKKLDLEADVRQYVPEFPDKGQKITTRHLLCHQSGIPHYSNGLIVPTPGRYTTRLPYLDPVLSLDHFRGSPLLFKPGEKDSYSSYAYILLSAVVQKAGGKSFEEQLQQRIAQPLKMESLQLDMETKNQPHWSRGYQKDDQGRVVRTAEYAQYWKHGAGGYKSNILDFSRWAQALINHKLVSLDAEKQMWTAQKNNAGEPTDRGLGFTVGQQGGLKISHNGLQGEATTRMVLYPESHHGVVVMCNCHHANVGAISTAVYTALNRK